MPPQNNEKPVFVWPAPLLRDCAVALGDTALHERAETVPEAPGAYVLVLDLSQPATVRTRKGWQSMEPGIYLYCGSARGPGGLRARLRRHLAAEKPLRWHVDRLSVAATARAAFALGDAAECTLADRLASHPAFKHIAPGFGSSDCTLCTSHLLRWEPGPCQAAAPDARP